MAANTKRKWWRESVVYQIYPRSFSDSNGDGIGDLPGITAKLDYLKSLGVDVIWLNPIYQSPNDDNGYDISDYRSIMSEFGTMADFDALLDGVHERKMRLIMDLVVNHSSDEHYWFQESRKSRTNPYRDYYHWWPAEKGTPPKRWSYFDLDDNAWKFDQATNAWYLHYFSVKQPDLKWENPKVRAEIYDMMRFWFEKGIDGFRMDVIPFISKDTSYPELPESYHGDFIAFYANGPRLHEFLHEMHREVLSHYDVMTVGEAPGVTSAQALNFVAEDREELNMFFHFDLLGLDREPGKVFRMRKDPWKLTEFKAIHSKWDAVFREKGWGSIFLCNHDFPRSVSRWGNDKAPYWRNSATMLHTFCLSMRGTPFFYQGEEIGMTNIRFDTIEDYRDINTLNAYYKAAHNCDDLHEFLENEKEASRDNSRTPMQWDNSENAGFTTGTPWIRVNPNFKSGINVAEQEENPDSVLNYFRKMIRVRKAHPDLVYGTYALLEQDHEEVYAYTREGEEATYLVLLSFSEMEVTFPLTALPSGKGSLIISNDSAPEFLPEEHIQLQPYQAMIYRMQ